jgi:hypothetical protein
LLTIRHALRRYDPEAQRCQYTISHKRSTKHTIRHVRGQSPIIAASPVLLMQLWSHSDAAAAAAAPKHRENIERDEELSHTLRSHTLACSQPSRQHHRTPPQKNSAFMLISSRGRPSEGGVLSRGRPSPKAGVSAMAKERGGRKMITSLSPRAKRPFYIAWPAPHRCLNRPRLRFDWRPEKKGDQSGTRRAASHTASKSVAYRVLPWGELT